MELVPSGTHVTTQSDAALVGGRWGELHLEREGGVVADGHQCLARVAVRLVVFLAGVEVAHQARIAVTTSYSVSGASGTNGCGFALNRPGDPATAAIPVIPPQVIIVR